MPDAVTPAPHPAVDLGPSPDRARRWADTRHLTRLLDSSIRIPGTRRRVGWDGVIGFVPVIGDAVGLALSGVVIARGVLLGARRWTVARMVLVASVDALVGLVPVLGGAFDLVFKANERNLATLERHALDRERTERASRRVVLVTLAGVAVLAAATIVGAVLATRWLLDRW